MSAQAAEVARDVSEEFEVHGDYWPYPPVQKIKGTANSFVCVDVTVFSDVLLRNIEQTFRHIQVRDYLASFNSDGSAYIKVDLTPGQYAVFQALLAEHGEII